MREWFGWCREAFQKLEAGPHTKLCIFLDRLLLSDLEALGLGGDEIVFVLGHCGGWVGGVVGRSGLEGGRRCEKGDER
jgi:hypothetical protein